MCMCFLFFLGSSPSIEAKARNISASTIVALGELVYTQVITLPVDHASQASRVPQLLCVNAAAAKDPMGKN